VGDWNEQAAPNNNLPSNVIANSKQVKNGRHASPKGNQNTPKKRK
jgi:hypothetical protein